jgi:hypothetical protein
MREMHIRQRKRLAYSHERGHAERRDRYADVRAGK